METGGIPTPPPCRPSRELTHPSLPSPSEKSLRHFREQKVSFMGCL